MFVIIAYDISDNRRRYRISRLLEGFGDRVQESVFETVLERSRFEILVERARKLIKEEEGDSVRFYCMNRDYRQHVVLLGPQQIFEVQDCIVV